MLVKPASWNFQYDIWDKTFLFVFVFSLVDTTPRRNFVSDDLDEVHTRSGRLVKPPLNFWCGQRELVDQQLNVTIEKGGVDYLSMVRLFSILLLKCILNTMNKPGEVSNRKSPALIST